MAAPTALTLLDLAKRTHNNMIMDVAEILTKKIPLLQMLPFVQATDTNSHLITRRGSLPSGTWRKLNSGVAPNKSDVTQVQEPIGLLEGWSEIDEREAKMSGNVNAYRQVEDMAHVEGMSQQLETALFYQTLASNIASIDGLATRFSSLDVSGETVWGAGGSTGAVASIWTMELGPQGLFGIYPHGDKQIGLHVTPFAAETKDSSGSYYRVLRTMFSFMLGLGIKDTRAVKRIANVTCTSAGVTTALPYLRAAINRLPGVGKRIILVSPTTMDALETIVDAKTNVQYAPSDPFGNTVLKYKGVPIYKSDKLLETETALTQEVKA